MAHLLIGRPDLRAPPCTPVQASASDGAQPTPALGRRDSTAAGALKQDTGVELYDEEKDKYIKEKWW